MIGIYLSGTGNTKYCITKLVKLIDASADVVPLEDECIFRKNRALAPHERSAVPLGTDHCPVG